MKQAPSPTSTAAVYWPRPPTSSYRTVPTAGGRRLSDTAGISNRRPLSESTPLLLADESDYSAEQLEEAYGAMVPSPSNTAADQQAQSRNGRPATGLAASQQHLFTRDGNQQQPAPITRLHLSSSAPDIDVLEQEGSTDGRADGHHSAEISIQDETQIGRAHV